MLIGRRDMSPSRSDSDLDPVRWELLSEMITAAAQGDSNGVHNAARRMGSQVPDDGVIGTYLWFLIHYHVPRHVGHPPTCSGRLALGPGRCRPALHP